MRRGTGLRTGVHPVTLICTTLSSGNGVLDLDLGIRGCQMMRRSESGHQEQGGLPRAVHSQHGTPRASMSQAAAPRHGPDDWDAWTRGCHINSQLGWRGLPCFGPVRLRPFSTRCRPTLSPFVFCFSTHPQTFVPFLPAHALRAYIPFCHNSTLVHARSTRQCLELH